MHITTEPLAYYPDHDPLEEFASMQLYFDVLLALVQDNILPPHGVEGMVFALEKWGMLTLRNLCAVLAITPATLRAYELRIQAIRTSQGDDSTLPCFDDEESGATLGEDDILLLGPSKREE